MAERPIPNGANGDRDQRGRFTSGNSGGPGNPHARRVAELRSALLDAITPDAIRYVMLRLVKMAVEGDVAAAKVLLDRVLGPPVSADLIARIEALEGEHE